MKISVYITSYNQKTLLVDAIESILAQTLQPHQIIVVDDASSDGSQDVIAGYAARYPDLFTPVYHQQNTGVAQVRNDALHAVTGDYVSYVDGDDRFLPTKLEKEAQLLLNNPQVDIAFSNYRYTDKKLNPISGREWITDTLPPEGDIFGQVFTRQFPRNTLYHMELLSYRCLCAVGFYDTTLKRFEDWDLRIRLTQRYSVKYLPEILSEVRTHDGPRLSRASTNVILNAMAQVVEKNKPLLDSLPINERCNILKTIYRKLRRKAVMGVRINLVKLKPQAAWESVQSMRHFNHLIQDLNIS